MSAIPGHTDKLAFPMINAPAFTRRSTTTASLLAFAPTKAYEPHVVSIPKDGVHILSYVGEISTSTLAESNQSRLPTFTTIGIP